MNAKELAIFNLKEVRRRSIKVWQAVPNGYLSWKPDEKAMSFGEIVRHVWTSIPYYLEVLKAGRSVRGFSEDNSPIVSITNEILLSEPSFDQFIHWINDLNLDELSSRIIDRSDVGYKRNVGDMLMRIAYHESVHTGQLLQYLRMANLERPKIWD